MDDATETTKSNTLTALDRCDSCGAQAFVYTELKSGYLLFCSHHWNQYRENLEPNLRSVIDETYKLTVDKRHHEYDDEVE